MTGVHMVVPDGIDDPQRPSGGNVYDRQLCRELTSAGWSVHEHAVHGSWPVPAPPDKAALGTLIADIPDGAVVVLDGLVASTAPEVLVPEAGRLRMVILVHMPLADGAPAEEIDEVRRRECSVLSAAAAVVTPSAWTQRRLLDSHPLRPDRVHLAEPGVAPAHLAPGTAGGGQLLCVAAVTPHKGHDVLLAALAMTRDLGWCCRCVGSLDRDPEFVDGLRIQARKDRLGDRVLFTGPRTGPALNAAYADADVLVLASRRETYGMVVTEALARGLPVIAAAVGGLPEALGSGSKGSPPGLLVPPEAPAALAVALRRWLCDADLRQHLRHVAGQRRETLSRWSTTADKISHVIEKSL